MAIHVKNTSVEVAFNELKPPATIEQDKMFKHEEQPTVNPTNNPSVTADDDNKPASSTLLEETVQTIQDPPVIHSSFEDNLPVTCIKNPSILAEDDKKPAATCLEETLLTMQQPPFMHPSLPEVIRPLLCNRIRYLVIRPSVPISYVLAERVEYIKDAFGRARHRKLARRAGHTSRTPCSSVSRLHA